MSTCSTFLCFLCFGFAFLLLARQSLYKHNFVLTRSSFLCEIIILWDLRDLCANYYSIFIADSIIIYIFAPVLLIKQKTI